MRADQRVAPETHERGGARVALCTNVEILDANTMVVEAVDLGPADLVTDPENPTPVAAEVPLLDNYVVSAGVPTAVEVDYTKNAAGDAIAFRIAETATSVAVVGDVPESAWRPA